MTLHSGTSISGSEDHCPEALPAAPGCSPPVDLLVAVAGQGASGFPMDTDIDSSGKPFLAKRCVERVYSHEGIDNRKSTNSVPEYTSHIHPRISWPYLARSSCSAVAHALYGPMTEGDPGKEAQRAIPAEHRAIKEQLDFNLGLRATSQFHVGNFGNYPGNRRTSLTTAAPPRILYDKCVLTQRKLGLGPCAAPEPAPFPEYWFFRGGLGHRRSARGQSVPGLYSSSTCSP
ncbi:hypothetical protein BC826DRAFT_964981 [Russula brevipes]|nr:hypothetical protein BC826DRAFT_964981 [Russula brevipes]